MERATELNDGPSMVVVAGFGVFDLILMMICLFFRGTSVKSWN